MKVVTKDHALRVIRRAYGYDHAEAVAERLPDQIDLDDPADTKVLYELGLTPDRLFNALGGEM